MHAILHPALSIRPSIGWTVGHSVGPSHFTFFINFLSSSHFKSCMRILTVIIAVKPFPFAGPLPYNWFLQIVAIKDRTTLLTHWFLFLVADMKTLFSSIHLSDVLPPSVQTIARWFSVLLWIFRLFTLNMDLLNKNPASKKSFLWRLLKKIQNWLFFLLFWSQNF